MTANANDRHGLTSTAKAWGAVALAFLGVLALAGLLFEQHRRERLSALEAQFEQNSARLSREVALQYDNYRQVVDNVTRILTSATLVAADLRQRDVVEAKHAAENARRRENEMDATRRRATQRASDSSRQRQRVDAQKKEAHIEVEQRTQELETANEEVKIALDEVTKADAQYDTQAKKVTAAQAALDKATMVLDAARVQTEAQPAAPVGSPTPPAAAGSTPATTDVSNMYPSMEPAAAGTSTTIDTSTPPLSVEAGAGAVPTPALDETITLARREQDRCAAELEAARRALELARTRADAALEAVATADATAEHAWEQVAIALRVTAQTAEERAAATEAELKARERKKAIETDYEALRFDRMKKDEAVSRVADPTARALVQAYSIALNDLVLPSQRALIDTCKNSPDVLALKLCVAKAFARVHSAPDAPLVMVKCPPSSRIPSLSEDGRDLLVPPSHTTGEPAACGKLSLRQLLGGGKDGSALPPVHAGDATFDAVLLVRDDGSTLDTVDFGSSVRVSSIPGFTTSQAAASNMTSVSLGASQYRIFSHPVGLRVMDSGTSSASTGSPKATDLVVCGLASETRLAKASLQISLHTYLWVVLLLAVGLLSLPLAKLWLLGQKTPYRSFDVTLLATSSVLFTLLGVVLVLAFLAHNRLARRADRQLETAGTTLAANLASNITASAKALRIFVSDSKVAPHLPDLLGRRADGRAAGGQDPCQALQGEDAPSVEFYDEQSPRGACEVSRRSREGSPEGWRLTFLMDRQGNQRVKIVPTQVATTAVSLDNRSYFRKALGNDTACLEPSNAGCIGRGVPELVRSVTTGSVVLVVAQPVCKEGGVCRDGASPIGVAAIETQTDAYRNLVLPLGLQAVLVDEAGRIMLHSANDAHHGQNIFEEVDAPEELRATLAGRVPETISLNYFGQRSRLRVDPLRLPGSGLSVLTLVPSSVADVATTDMVMVSLLAYAVLVAAALLVVCTAFVAWRAAQRLHGKDLSAQTRDHGRGVSLRPNMAFTRDYADIGVWSMRWGAVLCAVAILTTPGFPPTMGIAATVIVAAGTVRRVMRRRRCEDVPLIREKAPRSWKDFIPLTYLLCIAGFAEVFVMAPAAFMFAGAYDHVVDNLVRSEQEHVASALGEGPPCPGATTPPGTEQPHPPSCSNVIAAMAEPGSEVASIMGWVSRASFASPMPYLAELLPPVGPAQVAASGRLYRRRTANPEPGSASEHTSRREPTTMVLVAEPPAGAVPGSAEASGERVLGSTLLPRLVGMDYNWPGLVTLLLVVGAAIAAGHVIAFHSLRRLFFLDAILTFSDRKAATEGQQLLLSPRPSLRGRKLFVTYPTPRVFEHFSSDADWLELGPSHVADSKRWRNDPNAAWLIHGVGRPVDAVTLEQVDEVSRWAGAVVVLAPRNPLDAAARDPKVAWAPVLERFELIDLAADAAVQHGARSLSSATVARLWYESDEDEQRLLAQLATGGYVTPHPSNEGAVRRLAARGLLDPGTMTIRVPEVEARANEAFSPEQRAAWEETERNTAWAALRVPLSTGVAALLAAVTVSNPELGVASAAVPTLALGLPSVLKVVIQMLTPAK